MSEKSAIVWTLLGSAGGLAKAVLAILNRAMTDPSDPLHAKLQTVRLHLLDRAQKPVAYYESLYPNLYASLVLHEMDLCHTDRLRQHLADTGTELVIDVSWADTLDMLGCCNALGVAYVNSALENTAVDEESSLYGFPLAERFERFERQKRDFMNTKAVVCSGMNPGVVQWMAWKLLQEHPGDPPLACYIVEHDTSLFSDMSLIRPRTLYTSWSVECFLDEAIDSYPMFVRHRLPMYLYEEVYSAEYRVRLGDKQFFGSLMPHEEVLTLGSLADWEVGFLYRVNEMTTERIRSRLENTDDLWEWEQQVMEPAVGEVNGEDLVGVLLVYENEEKYMYNVMCSSEVFPVYQTNATYFQVACGLYAAACCVLLDPVPNGAHYVDELLRNGESRYETYLTRYMSDFIRGRNSQSDGFLHHRRKEIPFQVSNDSSSTGMRFGSRFSTIPTATFMP